MGMKIGNNGVARVTVSLAPEDVDLLDRLAALEESNRSAELRTLLEAVRPTLRATVEALEAANRTRDNFLEQAALLALGDLKEVLPEMEKIHHTYLGALSRLEGAAVQTPPASNTGVTFDTPPLDTPPLSDLKEAGDD